MSEKNKSLIFKIATSAQIGSIVWLVCLLYSVTCQAAEPQTERNTSQVRQSLTSWEQISNQWSSVPFQTAQQAANVGEPPAEYFIGRCYVEGTGAEKDPQEGLKWIRRAAEQGLAEAQN